MSYMRPTGSIRRLVRDTVSSVLALPDGAQGGCPPSPQSPMDVSDSEGRKRDREENDNTISGSDIASDQISDSLIGNTSIEQDARRRRLSAVSETPVSPSNVNPELSVSRQMAGIGEEAITYTQTIEMTDHIQHPSNFSDLSEQAARQNTLVMVQGINTITEEAISTSALRTGAPTHTLEWDDAGLAHQPMPPSPLPVPNLSPPSPPIAPAQDHHPQGGLNGQEIMTAVRSRLDEFMGSFKEELQSTCSNIDGIISAKLSDVMQVVEDNSNLILENKQAISITNDWVTLLEETQERHDREIQQIHTRMDEMGERETEMRNVTEQYTESASNNVGHIERLESAVSLLQRGSGSAVSSPQLQPLLDRINALERTQEESQTLMHQYRVDRTRQEDSYFLRSLSISGFHPLRPGSSSRSLARKVLSTISCEDVLSSVQSFSFNKALTNLRLTFNSIHEMNQCSQWLAEGMSQARRHDHSVRIYYRHLTPPRFASERKALDQIGMAMKKEGTCKRYYFVIQNDEIVMRVHKPGTSDKTIHAPQATAQVDRGENMEIGSPTSCSICGDPYNSATQLAIYWCGHSFHEICLSATIEGHGLKCPICREIPPTPSTNDIDCEQCLTLSYNGLPIDQESLCISSKCHHLHSIHCQNRFLASRQVDLPTTKESAEIMRLNYQFKGCYECSQGSQQVSRLKDLMYLVKFTENFPEYVDLGMNPPYARPQRSLPLQPTVMEVIHGSTGAISRRESNNGRSQRPPLSGSNAVPRGQLRDEVNPRHLGRNRGDHSDTRSCLLYTSPSPRDGLLSRMPSSA